MARKQPAPELRRTARMPKTQPQTKTLCNCGDVATHPANGKHYCFDCFNEVTLGVISHDPANTGIGRGGY